MRILILIPWALGSLWGITELIYSTYTGSQHRAWPIVGYSINVSLISPLNIWNKDFLTGKDLGGSSRQYPFKIFWTENMWKRLVYNLLYLNGLISLESRGKMALVSSINFTFMYLTIYIPDQCLLNLCLSFWPRWLDKYLHQPPLLEIYNFLKQPLVFGQI